MYSGCTFGVRQEAMIAANMGSAYHGSENEDPKECLFACVEAARYEEEGGRYDGLGHSDEPTERRYAAEVGADHKKHDTDTPASRLRSVRECACADDRGLSRLTRTSSMRRPYSPHYTSVSESCKDIVRRGNPCKTLW